MVRGVVVGGQPVWADLLLTGNVQKALYSQSIAGIPDVVQRAAALPSGADLPGGVGRFCLSVGAQQLVSRAETQGGGAEASVDVL